MTPREQAEKRLAGTMDGTEWARVDALKGIGWALLVVADSLSGAITGAADRVAEALVQSAGAPSPTGAQAAKQRLIDRAAQEGA